MTEFDRIVTKIDAALKASQGADRTVSHETADGRTVRVTAFIAGGSIRPGSFRSTWYVDGERMNRETARGLLQGRA